MIDTDSTHHQTKIRKLQRRAMYRYHHPSSSSSTGPMESSSVPIVYADAVPIDDPFVAVPSSYPQAIAVPVSDDAVAATATEIPAATSFAPSCTVGFGGSDVRRPQYSSGFAVGPPPPYGTSSRQASYSYNYGPSAAEPPLSPSSSSNDFGNRQSSSSSTYGGFTTSGIISSCQSQPQSYHPNATSMPLPLSLSDRSNQPTAPYVTDDTTTIATINTPAAAAGQQRQQNNPDTDSATSETDSSTMSTYRIRPGSRMTPYV